MLAKASSRYRVNRRSRYDRRSGDLGIVCFRFSPFAQSEPARESLERALADIPERSHYSRKYGFFRSRPPPPARSLPLWFRLHQ